MEVGGGVVSAEGRLAFLGPVILCDMLLICCCCVCCACIGTLPRERSRWGLVVRLLDGEDCWLSMGELAGGT